MNTILANLNEILKAVRDHSAQNMRTLAVFDLDSTLFNVSTRTQKIISEYADLHQMDRLKNVRVLPEDWGIKEALGRAGFTLEKELELLRPLRDFWSERFFSDEYLHYDVPYSGAVSFVQELEQAGCKINYLTGRDRIRMGRGSLEVLQKWGFPANEENLFLKPEKSEDDELFKHNWFLQLDRSAYSKIFFFENEPININAVEATFPDVDIVFLDTTHARKQEVRPEVRRIRNFNRF